MVPAPALGKYLIAMNGHIFKSIKCRGPLTESNAGMATFF